MYRLNGGPRNSQLVDELPPGYTPADYPPEELFGDFVAAQALWTATLAQLNH